MCKKLLMDERGFAHLSATFFENIICKQKLREPWSFKAFVHQRPATHQFGGGSQGGCDHKAYEKYFVEVGQNLSQMGLSLSPFFLIIYKFSKIKRFQIFSVFHFDC